MRIAFVLLFSSLIGYVVTCEYAGSAEVAHDVKSQLAPSGTLRVGLNMGNTLLTAKDPAGGEPRGVAIDIARELGRRLGVPVRFLSYESPGKLGDSIKAAEWDIAFFAIEPARAAQVDFSPPYVEIETTYLVRQDASFRTAGDVDRDGTIIAVTRGAGYESILSHNLKRAKLLRVGKFDDGIKELTEKRADAVAGLKPMLIAYTDSAPNARVVEGRFAAVQQAIGVQKGRVAGAKYVEEFLQNIKQSGFVAKAISDNNVRGLAIAK